MMKLKMETFESAQKIKIFDILHLRFAAQAIIAHQNFFCIFAIWRIFSVGNAENLDLLSFFERANVQLHHTSKWANSDRNSLMWLKMKSERSSQKQHFFSHFEQFQLKMRWKVLKSVLNLDFQGKKEIESGKG